MGFPAGGMVRTDNDISSLRANDTFQIPATFTPPAADTLYPRGLILGRVTANSKVVPYAAAAVDGSEIPMAILPEELLSDAGPADVPIEIITKGEVFTAQLSILNADPVNELIKDALQNFNITAVDSMDNTIPDN